MCLEDEVDDFVLIELALRRVLERDVIGTFEALNM